MACCSDCEWILARITKTKTLIEKYEDALLALADGAQSYSLDTGQTRQSVTKADVSSLRTTLEALENRLATLTAKLCGGGAVVVQPGF